MEVNTMGGCFDRFDRDRFRGFGCGGFDGGCGCGGEKKIRVITAVRAVCATGDFKDFDWL
jgi:hypothetical protein